MFVYGICVFVLSLYVRSVCVSLCVATICLCMASLCLCVWCPMEVPKGKRHWSLVSGSPSYFGFLVSDQLDPGTNGSVVVIPHR